MKKFRAVLFVVLACLFAFSLVACSASDPAKIKGERVNAEQWVKAFDFSDVTNVTVKAYDYYKNSYDQVTQKSTVDMYDGHKTGSDLTVTSIYENGSRNERFRRVEAEEDGERYRYEYDEDNGTWSRYNTKGSCIVYGVTVSEGYVDGFKESYAESYGEFSYDTKKKGYVRHEEKEDGYSTTLIKISDGKLVYVEETGSGARYESIFTAYFYDFDKTSVTLPTVADNS